MSSQPRWNSSTNTGMSVTWNGTISVAITSQKHTVDPRNRMRASA